jgi:hypothetical protein
VAKQVGFHERSALLHRLRVHALAISQPQSIGLAMYSSG